MAPPSAGSHQDPSPAGSTNGGSGNSPPSGVCGSGGTAPPPWTTGSGGAGGWSCSLTGVPAGTAASGGGLCPATSQVVLSCCCGSTEADSPRPASVSRASASVRVTTFGTRAESTAGGTTTGRCAASVTLMRVPRGTRRAGSGA
jgi:hypothetical protein